MTKTAEPSIELRRVDTTSTSFCDSNGDLWVPITPRDVFSKKKDYKGIFCAICGEAIKSRQRAYLFLKIGVGNYKAYYRWSCSSHIIEVTDKTWL